MDTNPTQWNEAIIDQANVDHWVDTFRDLADTWREKGDRREAAALDMLTEQVAECADDEWHDDQGRKVDRFEFRWNSTPLTNGLAEFHITLKPIRRAA